MHFFGGVDRLKPNGKRPRQIGGRGRRAVLGAHLEIIFSRARVTVAPAYGGLTIAFDQFEQRISALIAEHLPDQFAQRMHILTQARVFHRKLNALAIHNARLLGYAEPIIMSLLAQIAIFLAAAVVAIPVFRRFKLGSVLGYLAAGMIIGPACFGFIKRIDTTLHIAEFGIVLLMFVIGLELQPSRLRALRKPILGLASA
jgi:sodium/hydrogen exchanger family protein